MANAYGIITVEAITGNRKGEPLKLTFTNESEFSKTLSYLNRKRRDLKVTDYFFGYEIYKTAEKAIDSLNIWLPAR